MDEEKKCVGCGETFTLEAGEKKWMDNMGYTHPKRCPGCREKKRKEKLFEQMSDKDLIDK